MMITGLSALLLFTVAVNSNCKKNNPVRSYRPVRLTLTTCTSPLTITRIVNTHFYHYQYVDHIPTVPLRKIGLDRDEELEILGK
jgi:hypothetical protein